MMTTATNPPLRSLERTPDQPSREVLGLGGGCIVMMVLTLFISAIGAMILDNTLLKWLQKPFTKKQRQK